MTHTSYAGLAGPRGVDHRWRQRHRRGLRARLRRPRAPASPSSTSMPQPAGRWRGSGGAAGPRRCSCRATCSTSTPCAPPWRGPRNARRCRGAGQQRRQRPTPGARRGDAGRVRLDDRRQPQARLLRRASRGAADAGARRRLDHQHEVDRLDARRAGAAGLCAAKAAIVGFTNSLARDGRPRPHPRQRHRARHGDHRAAAPPVVPDEQQIAECARVRPCPT